MLFNSKVFVAFLIIVLAVYYQLPNRAKILFLLLMTGLLYVVKRRIWADVH